VEVMGNVGVVKVMLDLDGLLRITKQYFSEHHSQLSFLIIKSWNYWLRNLVVLFEQINFSELSKSFVIYVYHSQQLFLITETPPSAV
jgi:hypothetical protein